MAGNCTNKKDCITRLSLLVIGHILLMIKCMSHMEYGLHQILLAWIEMDGHSALDFLMGEYSARCVILRTFHRGTNKITMAEQGVRCHNEKPVWLSGQFSWLPGFDFLLWVGQMEFLSLRHFFWTLILFSALFAIKVVIVLVLSLLSGALTDAIRDVLINLSNWLKQQFQIQNSRWIKCFWANIPYCS